MNLSELQKKVDLWIQEHGVRYFEPLTNLGILMEEVGELSRVMVRTYGEQSYKEGANPESIENEIADVLWVLTCLANQTGVDLTHAMQMNIEKKTQRDKDRHKNNPKLK